MLYALRVVRAGFPPARSGSFSRSMVRHASPDIVVVSRTGRVIEIKSARDEFIRFPLQVPAYSTRFGDLAAFVEPEPASHLAVISAREHWRFVAEQAALHHMAQATSGEPRDSCCTTSPGHSQLIRIVLRSFRRYAALTEAAHHSPPSLVTLGNSHRRISFL